MDRIRHGRYRFEHFREEEEHEQYNDSGCGLDTTPEDEIPTMAASAAAAAASASKASGSTVSEPSKTSLSRRERYRKSLRRLKEKSVRFFRRERIRRPACIKAGSFEPPAEKKPSTSRSLQCESVRSTTTATTTATVSDAGRGQTGGLKNAASAPIIRARLVRQTELSSNESVNEFPDGDASIKSVHSESSSSSTSASDNHDVIWTKEPSASSILPPPPETTASLLPPSAVMTSYQKVLASVVNPLGCPDRLGFTKEDLIAYLQELFDVDKATHEVAMAEVQNRKPAEVILNVTVHEAKELRPCGTVESTNPSCVFGVDALQSPVSTPSISPSATPSVTRRRHRLSIDSITAPEDLQRFSDGRLNHILQLGLDRFEMPRRSSIRKRARSSLELDELIHTEIIKSTTNPVWNEDFKLSVNDIQSEALHLFVWHQPTVSPVETQERFSHRSRPSFKSLFRHLRMSQDGCRSFANCLGQIRIPLKDIPTSGSRRWYQLYRDKRQKITQSGQINLALHLSFKSMNETSADDDQRLQELHNFIRRLYEHELHQGDEIDGPCQQTESYSEEPRINQMISQQTIRCVLSQYAQHQNICPASQKLLELSVILETVVSGLSTPDSFLVEKISSFCESCSAEEVQRLTSYEISSLNDAISSYLELTRCRLASFRSTNKFFPPNEFNLEELESITRIAASLINLPLNGQTDDSSNDLLSYLSKSIQADVRDWLLESVEAVKSTSKDPVLEKTRLFVDVLKTATSALTPSDKIANLFNSIGIDYYKMASMVAETKLSSKAKELTLEMDKYQIRYKRFDVNINESSSASIHHYLALRDLFKTIRGNVNERELFRISLSDYQNWFKVSVTFWLQTFREQCLSRMETALKLDKDVVQVTSLVKHSNSSVDVLSYFNRMATEWREIDFADTDISLLGVTKITDTICDCVKAYMDKVIEIMEHNGYYDYIDNQQFDVTDRLCISLNNICQLSQYLSQLSTQLNWDKVTRQLSLRHESEDVGRRARMTLHSLVLTTEEEIQTQRRILAKQIIDKMAVDLQKNTMLFTRCPSGKTPEVESLLGYLEGNMNVLFQKLESEIFPLFWEEIWKTEIRIITQTLAEGKQPSYYKDVATYLESVRDFFERGGVEHCRNRSCSHYCNLLKILEMNSQSSEDLILQYYKSLAEVADTSSNYYGHLVVKVGYMPKADDSVSIYLSVIQGKDFPGMTKANMSNPSIGVSLCPQTTFPSTAEKFHTPVARATVNPVYGECFEFKSVARDRLGVSGAVILFSAWHHVPLFPNDFIGEIAIPLNGIRELVGRQTVEDLPAIMLPLRRPKEPKTGPYKVLKDRSTVDRVAQQLVNQRNKEVVFTTRCKLCRPVKCLVSTLTGKRLEIVGKQASVSTE